MISILKPMNWRIVLALCLLATTISFVWHTELVMEYHGAELTNGFMYVDGLKIYHVKMYTMFVFNFLGSYYLIKGDSHDRENGV